MSNELQKRILELSREKRFLLDLKVNELSKLSALPPIARRLNRLTAPLSFAQQRLWFLDQLESGGSLYNIGKCFRVHGPLNTEALRNALETILERHETLRTVFHSLEGVPVQVILGNRSIDFPILDLQKFPDDVRESELQKVVQAEAGRPFNLSQDLMLRVLLIRQGKEDHVLLLTMHHIASDAWSIGLLMKEIGIFYTSALTGIPPVLPQLPIQYADFSQWQRDWLQGENLQSQLSYWKAKLEDSPPLLPLPADRRRPALQSYRGAKIRFRLSHALTKSLSAISIQQGATTFMTVLAAFKVLLCRYSGIEDIVIGTTIANRNRTELENLVGFFVNTLVLRTDLSGNPSFRELLIKVREVALEAYSNQDLPFEKLVEELQPARSLSHSPLFQVLFVFQNAPNESLRVPGLAFESISLDSTNAKFDLTLTVLQEEEGTLCVFEYNTDLFNSGTIVRMASHLEKLLEQFTVNPDVRVLNATMLTEDEKNELMRSNITDLPAKCVHQLFEEQAQKSEEKIALLLEGKSLTYRELNERANCVAHYLQKLGISRESVVGLCMDRSVDMVIGLFAILKAGGCYLPLDPTYPLERLKWMIKDSGMRILLTQEKFQGNLSFSGNILCIDKDWETVSKESKDNTSIKLDPASIAYVIYTSGSTGKPKGVQVEHRSVVNFLESMKKEPGMTDADRLLAVTTLSFDIAALELYLPLTVGASIELASNSDYGDSTWLATKLSDPGITIMQATPVTWRMLLESGWQGSMRLTILCGGEALPWELAEKLLPKGRSLWNMYGPTETTIWSSSHQIKSEEGKVTIGIPIANTQMYMVDQKGNLVPKGVFGELCIGGAGVTRGYLNCPDLTAEKFVPDPFSGISGSRLYKTGDLGRVLENNQIELIGRSDHQIKLRGFRIELGEIESALRKHSTVQDSVLMLREDFPGDKRLVAYIIPADGSDVSITDLKSALRQELPEYMIPSSFVTLKAFPLTANGKLDRSALPTPELLNTSSQSNFEAPRFALEELLVEIWGEVLKLKQVGIQDNFFDLGGHSLLAVQVISRVRDVLGLEVPLRTLFEYPSVSGFGETILNNAEHPLDLKKKAEIILNMSKLSEEEIDVLWKLRTKT